MEEQNSVTVPEYRAHDFASAESLLGFFFCRGWCVTPLHGLLLTFWGDMGYPCFITGNNVCEKLIAVLLVALQKGKCRSHTFHFVFWGKIFLEPIWHRVSENADFQSQSGAQFSVTHSGKIRPDPWWRSVCFRGFSPQSAAQDRESRRWGDRCVCRRARYLDHFQIAYTIVELYCHSSLLFHRPHTLACEYRLVRYSWPVEIGWLHGSHSRWDCRCTLPSFNNSSLLLLLPAAIKT